MMSVPPAIEGGALASAGPSFTNERDLFCSYLDGKLRYFKDVGFQVGGFKFLSEPPAVAGGPADCRMRISDCGL